MRKTPLISTILPVYNGEVYITEAVQSILAQDFIDFELIIINDGSTDNSSEILQALAATDERIRLFECPNRGLVSALNQGIELSRSELIARMDADDIALPSRFRLQYNQMIEKEKLGLLGSFINIVDKDGKFIRVGYYPVTNQETAVFLENGCPLAHPSVMMRKKAIIEAGGYRKIFAHCEDYDLWLRVSELGYGIENYPKPLLHYRVHDNNISTQYQEDQQFRTVIALLSHQARKLGFDDPCDGVEKITPNLINQFPEVIRKKADAELFVKQHDRISIANHSELKKAWIEYSKLSSKLKAEKVTSYFLMRLFNGAIRTKSYLIACQALVTSLCRHPFSSIEMLLSKLKYAMFFRY